MRIANFELTREIVLVATLLGLAVPAVQGRQSLEFDLSRLSEKGRNAYSLLQTATMFRVGPVGYAGITSPEELALQDLMNEGEGMEALRNLCRSATPAGSLYALMGLRKRDVGVFEQEVRLFRDRSAQIEKSSPSSPSEQIEKNSRSVPNIEAGSGMILTQSGCEVFPEQQESILRRLERGGYSSGPGNLTIRQSNPPK